MKEQTKNIDFRLVGKESLTYHPSKVSWSVSQHISRENPLLERVILYVLVYMFLMIVAYAALSKVAISTKTQGALEYLTPSSEVLVQNDFTVETIYINPNDEVRKGEIILRGEDQLSQANIDALNASYGSINTMIQLDESGRCGSRCVQDLTTLSEGTFALERTITSQGVFKDYLVRLSSEFKNYINALENRQSLAASTSGLRLQIKQARDKIKRIERQGSIDILRMEYDQLKTELANLESNLSERQSSVRSNVRQARNAFSLSLSQLPQQMSTYIESHQIVAPMDGVVVFDKPLAPGQFLQARSKVLQVIPVGDPLIGRSLVSNKDIAKIQEGDVVKISLDALPEREFESVWGEVYAIAVDPKEDPQTKELKYEISIALDQQALQDYRGEEKPFRLGMTFQAQIITEYRSLLRVVIMRLLNIKDEYFGDYI